MQAQQNSPGLDAVHLHPVDVFTGLQVVEQGGVGVHGAHAPHSHPDGVQIAAADGEPLGEHVGEAMHGLSRRLRGRRGTVLEHRRRAVEVHRRAQFPS